MGHSRTLLCLSTFILLALSSFTAADDAAVMAKLLAALSPVPSGWSASTGPCQWTGVKCNINGRVTIIDLFSKNLSGTLPSNLGSLTYLTSLSLQGNYFSGPLPSLANLSSLQELYLDNNKFTSIPAGFFQGLKSLKTLFLSSNSNLSPWTIPTELNQSTSLVTLAAGTSNLVGSLPDIFYSFPSLKVLDLAFNNLTGPLPKSFGGSGIQNLSLNNQVNGLSGTIDVLSSMTQLHQVWLHNNQFTGPIPDLSKCTNLFELQLNDNQFTGLVPGSLMSLPSLKNISLDNNELQGPFPVFGTSVTMVTNNGTNSYCMSTPGPCDSQVTILLEVAAALGYPIKLASSWQGNDACAGWSFITCDSQKKIMNVNFGKLGFVGTISPAIANLTSLRTLYLNDNNLTGSIPDKLASLPGLQVLDVSNNNLTGSIPKFTLTVKFNATGNPLLGSPAGTGSGGSSVSTGMIAGIVIAVVIFVGVLVFVWIKCYVGRGHRKFGRVENPENGKEVVKNGIIGGDLPVFEGGNVAISIQVLRQVTNNFSEDNILGRGGSGVVYKGELHDGTKIAVKRMESVAMGSKGMKDFQAEIAVLTKVRHRHLVALLGSCVNGNERFLVFEYMPQGTLTQHLFNWPKNGCSPLTWKQRVTIALDVGRGVEYLHSLAQQSFIHRDLKPSNILLGDDMRAKVSDFGLVKNVPDGKDSVETRLAGTFGYLPPEYAGKTCLRFLLSCLKLNQSGCCQTFKFTCKLSLHILLNS
jgi:Leucine-rich repeat (LRR) protein